MPRGPQTPAEPDALTIAHPQQIVGRERRESVSQLAWCGEGCFDSRRRVNSTVRWLLSLTESCRWFVLLTRRPNSMRVRPSLRLNGGSLTLVSIQNCTGVACVFSQTVARML